MRDITLSVVYPAPNRTSRPDGKRAGGTVMKKEVKNWIRLCITPSEAREVARRINRCAKDEAVGGIVTLLVVEDPNGDGPECLHIAGGVVFPVFLN